MCVRKRKRRCLVLLAMGLLCAAAGCTWTQAATNAASFVFGAWFASRFETTTVEYRCFRGGVEIDCAELSELPEA